MITDRDYSFPEQADGRPWIYGNIVMTMDGKTTGPGPAYWPIGTREDWTEMRRLRAWADGLLVGAHTASHVSPPRDFMREDFVHLRMQHGLNPVMRMIIVSNSGKLDPAGKMFDRIGDTPTVLAVPRQRELDTQLEARAEVVRSGQDEVDLVELMHILYEQYKVKRLLCEGGPTLNTSMLQQCLLDEIFITLAPKVFGGQARTTTFDGEPFPPANVPVARLVSLRQEGDELYLRYRFG